MTSPTKAAKAAINAAALRLLLSDAISLESIEQLRTFLGGEYERQVFAAAGAHGVTERGLVDYDGAMVALVSRWSTRTAKVVWRRLKAMADRGDGMHVTTLFLLYGNARPITADVADVFRELAPLAHRTETVEAARAEIAAAEQVARVERTTRALDLEVIAEEFWRGVGALRRLEERIARLEGDGADLDEGAVAAFWTSAEQIVALDARIEETVDDSERESLEERRFARWNALGRKMQAALASGAASTKLAALRARRAAHRTMLARSATLAGGGATRVRPAPRPRSIAVAAVTAAEVLTARIATDPPDGRDVETWRAARTRFVADVKRDAARMRVAAHRAYRAVAV